MSTFTSTTYGLKLYQPQGWLIIESKEAGGLQVFPPQSTETTTYSDNLSIIIRKQEQTISTDPAILSYLTNEIIKSNYENNTNCVLLSLHTVEHLGLAAREFEYAYEDQKRNALMHVWQMAFIRHNVIYLLTFTARDATFHSYFPAMRELVGSMEWTD